MHVIVVGCGRVGSAVAQSLDQKGHEVVVVDRRPDALQRLGDGFGGRTLIGVGFDRATLRDAGITADSAVAAVTSGDNSNILIARVAREMFGVQRVVARIYDTRRAAVYERLGIPTVASVAWTSGRVLRAILPGTDDIDWTDPTASFGLLELRVDASQAGTTVGDLETAERRVSLLTRDGRARMPSASQLLQEGDIVHLMTEISLLGDQHGGEHGQAPR